MHHDLSTNESNIHAINNFSYLAKIDKIICKLILQHCFTDDINTFNGTISNSNRSSISSVESISQSNGKLNTQQSIVEVHSPPRDIILDVITDELALPPSSPSSSALPVPILPPQLPASKSTPTLPASKSAPTLSISKSAPILPVLKSASILSSLKSAPASFAPVLNSSMIPPMPPPLPPPSQPTPIGFTPLLQSQKSAPSTFTFSKTETSKNNKFSNGEY